MAKKNVRDTADASVILNSFRKSDNMGASIAEQIKWIGTTGKKMDAVIHATAVGCILMSMPLDENGFLNADPAIKLMNAMPKGSRAKALAAWFEAFSNIRVKLDGKTATWTGGLLKPTDKLYKAADPTTAFAKPFWSVDEKATDPKAFLLGEQLARLIKMASDPKNMADMTDDEKAFLVDLTKLAAAAPKRGAGTDAPVAPVEASADQSPALANAGDDSLETQG